MTDAPHPPPEHSPGLRAGVHFAALALAFPLTWLAAAQPLKPGPAWAAGLCVLLFSFNLLILPRLPFARRLARPGESLFSGMQFYPLSLALAFLLYPPYAVGAAWAALAAGDAAATVCGLHLPEPRLPWNRKKSWAGLAAFFAAAAPASALLLWWCPAPVFLARDAAGHAVVPEWAYVWTLALLAAASGALLETIPWPFDDNARVPLGVGLVVWLAALFLNFGTAGMPEARASQPQWLLHALVINAGLAIVVWAARWADFPGALAGGVIGMLVYFFALPQGYVLLILFVAVGSLLSRLGRKTKEQRGAAEAAGGRRGLANVLGNLTVPALCALAYAASKGHPAALWAFAGSLSAAFADTASAELGALSRRLPRLITTRKEVPHGTNGAITWLGYWGALGAALLLVGAAWAVGFWRVIAHGHEWNAPAASTGQVLLLSAVVVAAGLIGTTVDSLLGATVEGRWSGMNKHAVNFVCTLSGAAVAGWAGLLLG